MQQRRVTSWSTLARTHAHRCPRMQCGVTFTEAVGYRTSCVCLPPRLCLNTHMQRGRERDRETREHNWHGLCLHYHRTAGTHLAQTGHYIKITVKQGFKQRVARWICPRCLLSQLKSVPFNRWASHSYSKSPATLLMSCLKIYQALTVAFNQSNDWAVIPQ